MASRRLKSPGTPIRDSVPSAGKDVRLPGVRAASAPAGRTPLDIAPGSLDDEAAGRVNQRTHELYNLGRKMDEGERQFFGVGSPGGTQDAMPGVDWDETRARPAPESRFDRRSDWPDEAPGSAHTRQSAEELVAREHGLTQRVANTRARTLVNRNLMHRVDEDPSSAYTRPPEWYREAQQPVRALGSVLAHEQGETYGAKHYNQAADAVAITSRKQRWTNDSFDSELGRVDLPNAELAMGGALIGLRTGITDPKDPRAEEAYDFENTPHLTSLEKRGMSPGSRGFRGSRVNAARVAVEGVSPQSVKEGTFADTFGDPRNPNPTIDAIATAGVGGTSDVSVLSAGGRTGMGRAIIAEGVENVAREYDLEVPHAQDLAWSPQRIPGRALPPTKKKT